MQTACEAFRADWTQNAASIRAAEASETAAKEKPPTLQLQQVAESGVTKIFVSSTPAGADIEVDGGFVRNTPSTIDVASGEHLVKVSKNGYPEWARKLKASGGNVNLNVELAAQDK